MFNRGPDIPTVQVEQLPADGYLLDVREDDEWQHGHAPEAVHLPMSEIMQRVAEVPADHQIYVICKVGGRSAQVVNFLNAQGRDSINVAGGMLAWAAAGKPLVSATGQDPIVI
jgi:rhodanese-related sulfurtransferase